MPRRRPQNRAARSEPDAAEAPASPPAKSDARATDDLHFAKLLYESQTEAALEGILTVSPEGRILTYNQRFVELWGIPAEMLASRSAKAALAHVRSKLQEPEAFLNRIAALATGSATATHDEIALIDGRTFSRYGAPIRGTDGTIHGRVWFFRDITEAKRAEAERARILQSEQEARSEAERAQRRLAFLAEASVQLSASLDYQSTLVSVAHLAVPFFADWCAFDVVDEHGTERVAVAHVDPSKVDLARTLQRRYPPDPETHGHSNTLRTGASEFWPDVPEAELAEVALSPEHLTLLRDIGFRSYLCVPLPSRGRVLGTLTCVLGEGPRRYGRADLALAEDLARRCAAAVDHARLYREAQEAVRLRDQLIAREQTARAQAEAAERRAAFLAEASTMLASSLEVRTTLAGVARLSVPLLGDWCTINGVEDDGTIVRIAIAHADPAKQRTAEDMRGRYLPDPNAPFGVPKVLRELVPEFYPDVSDDTLAAVARDERHLEFLRSLHIRSYMCVPLLARGRPLGAITFLASEGERRYTAGDLALAEDLARRCALAIDNARLYEETLQDKLTGLHNRRFLNEFLSKQVKLLQRTLDPLSVVMMDLDHFKTINDSYGHEAGDVALRVIGGVLMDQIRQGDLAARYGGEEFALVLPQTDGDTAANVAERIRAAVAGRPLVEVSHLRPPRLSVSIGVAWFPDHGQDGDALLREADRALYQAKAAGRNRVTRAPIPFSP